MEVVNRSIAPGAPPVRRHPRVLMLAAIAGSRAGADVLTKVVAVARLEGPSRSSCSAARSTCVLVRNPGAAFSLATGSPGCSRWSRWRSWS